jgi:hypothetical protein
MKLALNGVMHILTDLLIGNVNPGFKANQIEIKKLLRMYQFILNLPISVVVSCSKLKIKKKKKNKLDFQFVIVNSLKFYAQDAEISVVMCEKTRRLFYRHIFFFGSD